MKTSFDLSEPLLAEVKALARERGTTTKSLVEQALRKLIDEAKAAPLEFKLPDASFKGGRGLLPEFENASWAEILEGNREGTGLPGRVDA